MKKTVSPILIIVLLAACTKSDVVTTKPAIQTASSDKLETVSDECKTSEWLSDENVFPRARKVTYNGCADEYGTANFGSKFIADLLDKKTAELNQLVRATRFANDFKQQYSDGKMKSVRGTTRWTLLERNGNLYTYQQKARHSSVDEAGNTQNTIGDFTVRDLDAETTEKTGTSRGSGVAEGSSSFVSVITSPVVTKSDFLYPVRGKVTVIIREGGQRHTQRVDYGNGEMDNVAMLSVDGAPATEVTLPLEGWGEYLGD